MVVVNIIWLLLPYKMINICYNLQKYIFIKKIIIVNTINCTNIHFNFFFCNKHNLNLNFNIKQTTNQSNQPPTHLSTNLPTYNYTTFCDTHTPLQNIYVTIYQQFLQTNKQTNKKFLKIHPKFV